MPDYLVKLYNLPPLEPALERIRSGGCTLRRALSAEKSIVTGWVARQFYTNWADECEVAFSNHPASCLIVTQQSEGMSQPEILGFACYNSVFKGFFGPTGTSKSARGQGVGSALLLASLHAMWEDGHAYAIIGSGGGADGFYRKTVEAIPIEGSEPGAYKGLLIPLPPEDDNNG